LEITEVVTDSLGHVLNSFYICQACRIVDRDDDRMIVGHPCSNCGVPSPAGRSYFRSPVFSMIDLMQEFYHAKHDKQVYTVRDHLDSTHNARLAVVIFFVSLGEALLDHLLNELMGAHGLPDGVRERLMTDNNSHSRRLENLFPSLVGVKWKEAMSELSKASTLDYRKLDRSITEIVRSRNTFLHQGHKVGIKVEMAEGCMRNIWPLLNLYVELHNRFVYPIFQEEKKAYNKPLRKSPKKPAPG
jgi:hypothetical protein